MCVPYFLLLGPLNFRFCQPNHRSTHITNELIREDIGLFVMSWKLYVPRVWCLCFSWLNAGSLLALVILLLPPSSSGLVLIGMGLLFMRCLLNTLWPIEDIVLYPLMQILYSLFILDSYNRTHFFTIQQNPIWHSVAMQGTSVSKCLASIFCTWRWLLSPTSSCSRFRNVCCSHRQLGRRSNVAFVCNLFTV